MVTVAERRQGKLLSQVLLFLLMVFVVFTVRDILTSEVYCMPPSQVAGYAMMAVACGFSRRRRPKLGAVVLVAMFPAALLYFKLPTCAAS